MPAIPYHATNFPVHWGPNLAGNHELHVSWADLVWAAVSVGKPSFDHLWAHGRYSRCDQIVRSHTVYANLREVNGYLNKSALYEELDPTEKGATSYFMGMMVAKLFAERFFYTPWLMHLSWLRRLGNTVAQINKSEPDLVGLNLRRDWIVAEAKGRTGQFSQSAMIAAKRKTRPTETG